MMITAPDLRDPGLCRNTLSFAEHRQRLATHGWPPLSRDQARALFPDEDTDAWFDARADQAAARAAARAALQVEATAGATTLIEDGTVLVALPFETRDPRVIAAALHGVHAGIALVEAALAARAGHPRDPLEEET